MPPKEDGRSFATSNGKLDLTVKKLPTETTNYKVTKYADKWIFPNSSGESRVLFAGPSGSGKSNLCITLLTNPKMMLGHFDHIYVYCPSAGMQADYAHLRKSYDQETLEVKDFSAEQVQEDWDLTKQICKICLQQGEGRPQTLFLFDDLINTPDFDKVVSTLNTKARHDGVSVWVLAQGLMSLPRLMRIQASNIFTFSPTESEIERLSKECTNALCGEKQVAQMIKQATSERFQSFHFNRHAPSHLQYRSGLTNYFKVHDPSLQQHEE